VIHSIENSVLEDSQCLVRCPFCRYVEIHEVNDNMPMYLNCRGLLCGKISCLGCRKEVPYPFHLFSNYLQGPNDFNNLPNVDHTDCQRLGKLKAKIEVAIKKGLKTTCPKCHVSGVKDGGCTHMTCQKCCQIYCYICELPLQKLDCEGDDRRTIYNHNTNWEINPKRCPMYLMSISLVDRRWPATNDTDCLAYFHKVKCMKLLRSILVQETKHDIDVLEKKFMLFDKNGFKVAEIMNCKEMLIKPSTTEKRCSVM